MKAKAVGSILLSLLLIDVLVLTRIPLSICGSEVWSKRAPFVYDYETTLDLSFGTATLYAQAYKETGIINLEVGQSSLSEYPGCVEANGVVGATYVAPTDFNATVRVEYSVKGSLESWGIGDSVLTLELYVHSNGQDIGIPLGSETAWFSMVGKGIATWHACNTKMVFDDYHDAKEFCFVLKGGAGYAIQLNAKAEGVSYLAGGAYADFTGGDFVQLDRLSLSAPGQIPFIDIELTGPREGNDTWDGYEQQLYTRFHARYNKGLYTLKIVAGGYYAQGHVNFTCDHSRILNVYGIPSQYVSFNEYHNETYINLPPPGGSWNVQIYVDYEYSGEPHLRDLGWETYGTFDNPVYLPSPQKILERVAPGTPGAYNIGIQIPVLPSPNNEVEIIVTDLDPAKIAVGTPIKFAYPWGIEGIAVKLPGYSDLLVGVPVALPNRPERLIMIAVNLPGYSSPVLGVPFQHPVTGDYLIGVPQVSDEEVLIRLPVIYADQSVAMGIPMCVIFPDLGQIVVGKPVTVYTPIPIIVEFPKPIRYGTGVPVTLVTSLTECQGFRTSGKVTSALGSDDDHSEMIVRVTFHVVPRRQPIPVGPVRREGGATWVIGVYRCVY
jgi:hypothetical protein